MKSSFAYLLAPFIGWLVAQTIKNILGIQSGKYGRVEKYLTSGGMPSAHTATVITLVTVIFVHEGCTALFAVVVWVAALTVYDSLVARRSIGEQGTALTKLLKTSGHKGDMPKVALGHKPVEVVVGAIIGVLVGWIVALFITN